MRCPVCGERGRESECKQHRKDVCICCHMCTETAMSMFVTCEHYRDTTDGGVPPGART